jgi:hypothetical protein
VAHFKQTPKVFQCGEIICKQREQPDALYILKKGVCRVEKFPDHENDLKNYTDKLRIEVMGNEGRKGGRQKMKCR